jgi:hypothetical protein
MRGPWSFQNGGIHRERHNSVAEEACPSDVTTEFGVPDHERSTMAKKKEGKKRERRRHPDSENRAQWAA